ncbi:MAG: hypothetical protein B1H08_04905 [Candidatus Omnitrophica bacterium 4484_171]|nr:MAG: hypothetical protein B1H08_04905 [Candidatus Omnitrophica bacterium 4484_171]
MDDSIVLAAKMESLDKAVDFIVEGASKLKFSDKDISQIRLAAEEIVVNIINYAYPEKAGNMRISYRTEDNNTLVVEIVDSGIAFNPLSLPEPDVNVPLDKRKIGGLGVYLVKKIMDDVNYERKDGRNILVFTKTAKNS